MIEGHQYLSESHFISLVVAGGSCKQSGHTGRASGPACAHGLRQSRQTGPPTGLVEKYRDWPSAPEQGSQAGSCFSLGH